MPQANIPNFTFNLAIYACNIEEEYFDNYLQQLFIDLKYFSSLYISTFKTQKNEEEEEEEEEQENWPQALRSTTQMGAL